jgi:pimeloyl-ACP methyl ester carboxylesterase
MDTAPRIVRTADGREVGYRRLGEGPPVVLLHASPRSAAALLPLAARLADRFTVFAFDTPGFGWSEPLRIARPDSEDYGDALIGAMEALGIARAPVYGSHTGAAIAVAAAIRHPGRISALALDGYAIFTPTEQAEYIASYLAPIRPDWDGTHLAFLWGRVKDQFSFFPWYLRGQAARLPRPLLPPAAMQAVVVDFLAAGDAYRPAYASAFRFPGLAGLRALTVPTVVMARSDDLLFGHLDALTGLPPGIAVQRLPADDAALAAAVAAALAPAEGAAPAVPPPQRAARPQAPAQEVLRVPGGTIGAVLSGRAEGRPVVLLPPIPGSARGLDGLARALGHARPVIALDLPGFGASAVEGPVVPALRAALAALGVAGFDTVALGESAAFALDLATAPVLLDPVPETARAALREAMVDVTPRIDGTHLLAAWHQLRDMALWRPWIARDPAHALDIGTDPDLPMLQAVMTDWMRGGAAGRATLGEALAAPLALPATARLVTTPGHPWAAAAAGTPVSGDHRARAEAILRLLGPA